jgi:hypothetical protein
LFGTKSLIKIVKQIDFKFDKTTIVTLIVFIVGIVGQMLVISPSGIFKNGDLVFWSSNGHDAPWHIALMEEIKKGYPFQNPVFAGEKLVNYHFFSDIVPAIVSKYLPISDLNLYSRIFPFFYALLFGAAAYYLTKKITNSKPQALWATIFSYFAGSFGYLIGKGESVFWATQPQSSSGNPPQIVSDFIILGTLYFLVDLLQKKGSKFTFWICVLLTGTLAEFKVYAAIVLFGALGMVGIWQLLRERKIQLLLLTALGGILAAILYLPNSSGSVSFLIFQPWWYIRTMIVEPSRLNLLDWELRRQTYVSQNNWKRVIFLEGLGFLIFFFGNLGMRFIGLWDFSKLVKKSEKPYFKLIFLFIIVISLVMPLLFLQKGVASNTSQFLQYFVLLFGILAGITAAKIIKLVRFPVLQILVAIVLIATMIPTQIGLLHDFYGSLQNIRQPFTKISASELQALNYIKNDTPLNTVILTPPYDTYPNLAGSTPNIWNWSDSSYVSAFSERRTYFDDHEQVDIMGYDWKERLALKDDLFKEKDPNIFKSEIDKTGAEILYFPESFRPVVNLEKAGLTGIYKNQGAEVWKIN